MSNQQTQILGQNKKFWNFIKNAATETTPETIELRIEGNFVDSEDAWIYEWFGIPVASPNAFRNELAQYKGQNITVWINSYGGSVFAAAGIYNALMEHKKTGAKITTKADSKVMSAATIPYMAGDERFMGPMDMFMMHNPLPGNGVYGYASDLRKVADVLDTVKETIMNAYQLGTGLSREKISSMMDDETYMSAKTAVKEGFATGVLYSAEDKTDDVMNFSFSHMAIQNSMADSVQKLLELAKKENLTSSAKQVLEQPPGPDANNKNNNKQEGKTDMEIKNSTEFKAQLPAIHDEVYNSGIAAGKTDGVKAERERLKAFDVLNGKVDPEFLATAKYEDGATAESVLFKAMQEGKMINAAYVTQAEADASTANSVAGDASDNMKPDEVTGILNKVANVAKKALGISEGGNK